MSDHELGILPGFSTVDATGEADQFIAYLDAADHLPIIVDLRARVVDALKLRPGECLIDVGCGTGTALFQLSGLVGPGGRAVGIDVSDGLLAVAKRRCPPSVELIRASATALPFADESFDAYRAERVYLHLDDPKLALAEARRVLRPGGRLVLAEPDWEGLLLDEPDPGLVRRALTAVLADRPGVTIGRRLHRLLVEQDFTQVWVEGYASAVTTLAAADRLMLAPILDHALALGAIDAEEVTHLRRALRDRDAAGAFFVALSNFIATATRP